MIRFVGAKTSVLQFIEMYRGYVRDLTPYSNYLATHAYPDSSIRENYLEDELVQSYFIYDDNQIIGFIVLQYVDEKYEVSPPMWYIVEFYIAPEYRGRGYGTKAVEHFLHEFPGDFFYYILRQNAPAKQFWASITRHFNLRETFRSDVSPDDISELELHCFFR
jgi:predicted acetyltransferase